jgi:hypothetical protein
MVGSLKMGVGRVSVSEGVSKLTVEVFTFIVIPFVHGTGPSFEGRRGGFGVMGIGLKSGFPNGGRKTSVFGIHRSEARELD